MPWLIKHASCVLISRSPKRIMFLYFLKLVIIFPFQLKILIGKLPACNDNFVAAREDKLQDDNRSTVNSFQSDLAQQLSTLSSSLAASVSQQREHLQIVENLCNSFLQIHDKVFMCNLCPYLIVVFIKIYYYY